MQLGTLGLGKHPVCYWDPRKVDLLKLGDDGDIGKIML